MILTLTLPGRTDEVSLDLDDGSARRALLLKVVEIRPGHFQVEGSEHPYYVSVTPNFLCCCQSAVYGAPACKHVIAALAHVGGPAVRRQIEATVGTPRLSNRKSAPPSPTHHLGRDLGWAEAMQRTLADPGDADLLALSRVLTDPALKDSEALQVAKASLSPFAINTLTKIPEVLKSRAVRAAISEHTTHVSTVARLMPYSDLADFRVLFRGLLRTGDYTYAVRALRNSPDVLVATLERPDLLPLFQAEDPEVRTAALTVLSRLMEAEPSKGHDLPVLEEGQPIFALPPKPELTRRGVRR